MLLFFYYLHRYLASSKLEFILSDDLITVVCKTPFLGSNCEPTLMFSIHELSAINSNNGFKFGSIEFIHKSGKIYKFITSSFNRKDQTHLLITAIENRIREYNQQADNTGKILYNHNVLKQPILSFLIPSLVVIYIVCNALIVSLSDIKHERWVIFSVILLPLLLLNLYLRIRSRSIRKMDTK
ncbi:MAG: hypothetical protein MUC81_11890 [Bacteroidia bacterium]|jgi:hypothetical protein|nr:hypothetical protein [Bacteroidia bacterium]